MKRITTLLACFTLLAAATMMLQGCFKDKCTRTYRMFTPVYQTTAAVRANIRSSAPQSIVSPGKLFIKGNYIFLNEIDKGVHILDNSNPASPKNVAFINIPGNMDLAVTGNTLYADLYIDLVTLDISDPLHVAVKKITNNAFPFRRYQNGFTADTSKIIVDWIKKDTTVTVDCAGGSSWGPCAGCGVVFDLAMQSSAAGRSPVGMSGSMARFTIINNNLYTVSDFELNVYSIVTPENPVFSGKVTVGSGIETIFPFQDRLFIGSGMGMFIYNVSSPNNPVKMGQFSHARACDPVIADEQHAFVTLRDGNPRCSTASNQLDVLDVSNLSSPVLLKTYPMTNPHGLSKDGNTLFICDGKDGLKVYNATRVNELKLITHIKGIETYDVIAFNKLAVVVTKDGLKQFNYSDLNNIKLLGSFRWAD